jgi:hypothetical protein
MSNITWSEQLNLVSDQRVLRYAGPDQGVGFVDTWVIRIEELPGRWDKTISVEHEHGPRGGFSQEHIGYFTTLAAARRAINRRLQAPEEA